MGERRVGGTDPSGSIQGRRFASNGTALDAQEFQVNSYATSFQLYPSVASDFDGDFVVAWESYGSSGSDTSAWSVQGQRFASNGTALAAEFQVNSYTTSVQDAVALAVDANGNSVVAWESQGSYANDKFTYSIQGQRYLSEPDERLGLALSLGLLGALDLHRVRRPRGARSRS